MKSKEEQINCSQIRKKFLFILIQTPHNNNNNILYILDTLYRRQNLENFWLKKSNQTNEDIRFQI